jgi:hypothetical protein
MSEELRSAIRAVVAARLSSCSRLSGSEDVEAMAEEAITLTTDIEGFRPLLSLKDSPEPLRLLLGRQGSERQ